jgi:hypothetical protein
MVFLHIGEFLGALMKYSLNLSFFLLISFHSQSVTLLFYLFHCSHKLQSSLTSQHYLPFRSLSLSLSVTCPIRVSSPPEDPHLKLTPRAFVLHQLRSRSFQVTSVFDLSTQLSEIKSVFLLFLYLDNKLLIASLIDLRGV